MEPLEHIPENCLIKDTRTIQDLKTMTLSNYRKTDVKNALIDSMLREKIEHACHWSAELICSGHLTELWDMILLFFSKYIYLGNPKIPLYLRNRYKVFRNIMNDSSHSIDIRNNHIIRELFVEIICVFTFSKKINTFEHVKLDREEEFDMTQNKERFKSPSLEYANQVMKPEDPAELFIAINELLYNLSIGDNKYCCYWVDWIIEFDSICRNKREPCHCVKRDTLNVETKYYRDIIWLIWESIIYHSGHNDYSNFIVETVLSLFELFCIRYTNACSKKRRHIIYYAISVLVEPVDSNINIIHDKNIIDFYKERINEVYKQIKKKEIVVFNEHRTNHDRSINQMDLINSSNIFSMVDE
jgi:hypothetical protein